MTEQPGSMFQELPPLGGEKSDLRIRRGFEGDAESVLTLIDDAIAWFVSIGNVHQWGTAPWSADPVRRARISAFCAEAGSWIAEDKDGNVLGALVVGGAHDYVPPMDDELYIRLLIGARSRQARGVGRRLLMVADQQARRLGRGRLRVDCYAGGSGKLVKFYESCGYRRTETFSVGTWPGQLLVRELS
ncbi:GNAT family N-acetyltransferase [Nonomuraea insulae]|uniref:GNAT family N-acetyltransferase n=1 Tax=Nonomuraea insulae TaxID=1616787 RepID=A0ABW1CL84_9ACTN